MARSIAPREEIEFVAVRIHAKVWNKHPDRWVASVRSAEEAIAALQDYTADDIVTRVAEAHAERTKHRIKIVSTHPRAWTCFDCTTGDRL